MRWISALLAGALFGGGLFVSGMTDTAKVQGWLDVFGDWDPTLAFVLAGAILPMTLAWVFARGRRPLLGGTFPARPAPKIGADLILGSVMFGVGWGLVGLCPGPAMASLGYGGAGHWLFLAAMIAGMIAVAPIRSRLPSLP